MLCVLCVFKGLDMSRIQTIYKHSFMNEMHLKSRYLEFESINVMNYGCIHRPSHKIYLIQNIAISNKW